MNPQLYLFSVIQSALATNNSLVTVILIEMILDSCRVTDVVMSLYFTLRISHNN